MEILKIVGIGFITLFISIMLKDINREYSLYAVILGTSLILFISFESLKNIIYFIQNIGKNFQSDYIKILLKMTGIAILTEYAVSLCKDSGENAIASKIDFAGKITLVSLSIPVISSTLDGLTKLLY